jgi:hypothetical protein
MWIPLLQFDTLSVARAVTAKVVGSGALLGSGEDMKTDGDRVGEEPGETQDILIFREAAAIERSVRARYNASATSDASSMPKPTVVHAATASLHHCLILGLELDSSIT